MFVFFIFLDLVDLHSFPTRRSSDLDEQRRRHLAQERRAHDSSIACFTSSRRRSSSVSSSAASDTLDDLLREDRKSTRLNSSHLSISYAVFCLKRKTRETPSPLHRDA